MVDKGMNKKEISNERWVNLNHKINQFRMNLKLYILFSFLSTKGVTE